jgi:hypothetical protein
VQPAPVLGRWVLTLGWGLFAILMRFAGSVLAGAMVETPGLGNLPIAKRVFLGMSLFANPHTPKA